MKQLFLTVLFAQALTALSNSAHAQAAATGLDENFESNCPAGSHHPNGWVDFNPIASTRPEGQWLCNSNQGRGDSKGIKCTGLWGSPMQYHLDTAYLISPLLDLSGYGSDRVYLRFDSKTSKINLGAKLTAIVSKDSNLTTYVDNLEQLMTPVISNDDSTDWVTHEFDLSGFTNFGDFYIAFRYTSTATAGSVWFLDNIYTSTISLSVPGSQVPGVTLPLTASGNSETGEVKVAFTAEKSDVYDLAIYDLVGRRVHSQQLNVRTGTNTYVLRGIDIHQGIYIVKTGNSANMGTTRFVAR
jgi:hypothetical protein